MASTQVSMHGDVNDVVVRDLDEHGWTLEITVGECTATIFCDTVAALAELHRQIDIAVHLAKAGFVR